MNWTVLKASFDRIYSEELDILENVCHLLYNEVRHYNWVGFYFMNDQTKTLEIGPYKGAVTDHTLIPYGTGICGQVAVSGVPLWIKDVKESENYLSCSIDTKSEVVYPIYHNDQLLGQLDIDSHFTDPFSEEDKELLQYICKKLGPVLAKRCI